MTRATTPGTDAKQRTLASPLGPLTVRVERDAICELAFADEGAAVGDDDSPLLREAERQLRAYFARQLRAFDLPLSASGTAYQQRVWHALLAVPHGTTTSYGALAARLGSVARAIGSANGANPIAIVVPCHRVIGNDGSLTGYAGGLDRKRWLLQHEGAVLL